MRETFLKIWKFGENRHQDMKMALGFSFLRALAGITQMMAIFLCIRVVTGEVPLSSGLLQIGLLCVLCVAAGFVTSYFEQIHTMTAGFMMTGDQRVQIAKLLRRVPLGFFTASSTGKICATLTTTLSGVESAAVMVVVGIISGLFGGIALFLFLLFYEWRSALLMGCGMLAYLFVVGRQMKISRKNAPALQKAQSGLAESALTFLQGIGVIKAFGFLKGDKNLKAAIDQSRDENIRLTRVSMPSQFGAGLVIAVFESLLLGLSLFLCLKTGDISCAKAVVLMIFSFMAYASLNQAGSMLSMIGLLDAGIDEAADIEKTPPMEEMQPEEKAENAEIVLEQVRFSYGDREVLKGVSAVLKPGTRTALVGPSGSGKTTLCHLIPRFFDVTGGKITIGGADVRHMKNEELMKKISMVFQHVYLFEDTILNNILFGRPDASMEEVVRAAKAARCHDFIMKLPKGYDTLVEEGGGNLSGGEKQRLSIARAMLKDAPIVLLDEATSALDAENEQEILAAMEELTRNKTVLMIAHRVETVEKADQILVLQDGQLVQKGTDETLKKEEGLYRDFVRSRKEAALWRL